MGNITIENYNKMIQEIKQDQMVDEISKKKLIHLDKLIKDLLEVVKFYGDKDNWVQELEGSSRFGVITHTDISCVSCENHFNETGESLVDKGGKKAKEILQREDVQEYLK